MNTINANLTTAERKNKMLLTIKLFCVSTIIVLLFSAIVLKRPVLMRLQVFPSHDSSSLIASLPSPANCSALLDEQSCLSSSNQLNCVWSNTSCVDADVAYTAGASVVRSCDQGEHGHLFSTNTVVGCRTQMRIPVQFFRSSDTCLARFKDSRTRRRDFRTACTV